MRQSKPKSFYKKELNNIIKLISKKHPEVLNWIDVNRYCSDTKYRKNTKHRLLHLEKAREYSKMWHNNHLEYHRKQCNDWNKTNVERRRIIAQRYRKTHPEIIRYNFDKRTINNPRKAMLCAAASRIANAIINRLGIRPTVCPHCGRSNCLIDFHHPNHLFWWKGTFCCKSCHHFFNRDKVPASDKIIDLKKLLRESNSH